MKPCITLLTLCVDDLERSVAFYRDGLGFATKGIVGRELENCAVAFFNLDSGLKLALWPRKSLAADAGLSLHAPNSSELSIGHNDASDAEVDAVMALAATAGARIIKHAQRTLYGGYAGYCQDPDGHLWEVAHVPGFGALLLLAEIGRIERFASSHHLAAYAGLVPSTRSSGDKTAHGTVDGAGSPWLKWVLIEIVQTLKLARGPIGVQYQKLLHSKGKAKATVAAARNLCCYLM